MRQHKTIWTLTLGVVLTTLVVLTVRRSVEAPGETRRRPFTALTEAQSELLVKTMLACVEKDPQARRARTRFLVETAAALAEDGVVESAETYFALGLRRYGDSKGGPEQGASIVAYKRAIELQPAWGVPYNGLGIALMASSQREEAEAALHKAIELDPSRSRPHNDLAILLRLFGELDEAEKHARIALQLDPNDVACQNNYGNLLLERGRVDEAADQYRRAIELEPDQPAPYYNLACLAARRNDREAVLANLNCAIVLGEAFREEAGEDPEFSAYWEDPDFRRLVHGGD